MKFPRTRMSYACGAAAVRAIVLHFEGINLPELDIAEELKTDPETRCTFPYQITKYLRKRGYTVKPKHGMTLRSLRYHMGKGDKIIITPFWNHFYVLYDLDGETCHFYCPVYTRMQMGVHEFLRSWLDKDLDENIYNCYGIVVSR